MKCVSIASSAESTPCTRKANKGAKKKMADKKNPEKKEVAKKKSDKPGLWQKIKKFFREYKSELKKISWPTFPEVVRNSLVTIAVVVIVGLFIWGVDTILTLGREALLKTDKVEAPQFNMSESDLDLNYVLASTADIFADSELSEASISDMYPEKEYYVLTVDGKYDTACVSSDSDVVKNYIDNYKNITAQLNGALANMGNVASPTETATPSDAE